MRKKKLHTEVCKPCWELKYCPYGPLVEQYPVHPEDFEITTIEAAYDECKDKLLKGEIKTEDELWHTVDRLLHLDPQKWRFIKEYKTDELVCRIFGHVCPVFFDAEPFTEMKEERKTGREIPRKVFLAVVKRDGYFCRICRKNIVEDEVVFDHIIPFSKGGPTDVNNLRIVCSECNQKRGASLDDMLRKNAFEV
ncbi:MAG: HNH endonuclease [Bellilinea sp.]